MGRRIITNFQKVAGALGGAETNFQKMTAESQSTAKADDYLGRLLKYIPAELVGLYLAARGLVPVTQEDGVGSLWVIALSSWILVPIYLYLTTKRKGERTLWWQVCLGTIAFPVWVFAVGGEPVTSLHWYAQHLYLGSVALMFVTVIFGLIEP